MVLVDRIQFGAGSRTPPTVTKGSSTRAAFEILAKCGPPSLAAQGDVRVRVRIDIPSDLDPAQEIKY